MTFTVYTNPNPPEKKPAREKTGRLMDVADPSFSLASAPVKQPVLSGTNEQEAVFDALVNFLQMQPRTVNGRGPRETVPAHSDQFANCPIERHLFKTGAYEKIELMRVSSMRGRHSDQQVLLDSILLYTNGTPEPVILAQNNYLTGETSFKKAVDFDYARRLCLSLGLSLNPRPSEDWHQDMSYE